MSIRVSEADGELYRELVSVISPITKGEIRSWRFHFRTMATTTEDGTLPESTTENVGADMARKIAEYLTPYLRGKGL